MSPESAPDRQPVGEGLRSHGATGEVGASGSPRIGLHETEKTLPSARSQA